MNSRWLVSTRLNISSLAAISSSTSSVTFCSSRSTGSGSTWAFTPCFW